jgi:quercetin dioxygenase-like cupin family protein
MSVSIVHFPTGVLRPWSNHESDQYVWVLDGKGVIVTEDEEHEVELGTAVYIPAGLKHRHGSSRGHQFTQLSIIGGTNE